MHVALQPGTHLVCNCRDGHRGLVSADGAAPPLPAMCTGSFWSLPLDGGASGRIYGAPITVGVVTPRGTRCAYLT